MGSTARASFAAASAARRLPRRLLAVGQAQPGRPVVGMPSHPRPQLLDRAVGGAVRRNVDRQPRPLVGVQGVVGNGAVVAVEVGGAHPLQRPLGGGAVARPQLHQPLVQPHNRLRLVEPAQAAQRCSGAGAAVGIHQPPHRDPHIPGRQAPLGRAQHGVVVLLVLGRQRRARQVERQRRPAGECPAGGCGHGGLRAAVARAHGNGCGRSEADHGRQREQHDQPPAAAGNMFAGWLVHTGKGMEFGSIPRYNSEGSSGPGALPRVGLQ